MSDRAWLECALRGEAGSRPAWQRTVPLVCCPPARALVLRFTRPLLPFLENSDRRMFLFFNRPLEVLSDRLSLKPRDLFACFCERASERERLQCGRENRERARVGSVLPGGATLVGAREGKSTRARVHGEESE